MTTIIEITHHRDLMLPLDDEVREWLTRNGIDPGTGPTATDTQVGIRGSKVYFVQGQDARPVRIDDGSGWRIVAEIEDALKRKGARWAEVTADIGEDHYGFSAPVPEDVPVVDGIPEDGPIFAKLERHLMRGIERTFAPDCTTAGRTSACSGKAALIWTPRHDYTIDGHTFTTGIPADLCTGCVAWICTEPGVNVNELFERPAPRFEFVVA